MKRRAFTLIELLVVIAIITTLLAILLPSMGRSIEITIRAQCGSNSRQIIQGAMSFAVDHMGVFPDTQKVGRPDYSNDDLKWLGDTGYEQHMAYLGGPPDVESYVQEPNDAILFCPNRVGVPGYRYRNVGSVRVGYYLMYSHGEDVYNVGMNPWASPRRVSEASAATPLTADVIEKGTISMLGGTNVTHASTGYVESPGNPLNPEQIGSEGLMIGLGDASVSWRKQSDTLPHRVYDGDASIIGYW